jgi:hypothetical protein
MALLLDTQIPLKVWGARRPRTAVRLKRWTTSPARAAFLTMRSRVR